MKGDLILSVTENGLGRKLTFSMSIDSGDSVGVLGFVAGRVPGDGQHVRFSYAASPAAIMV